MGSSPEAAQAFFFLGLASGLTVAANVYQQAALATYDVRSTAAASLLSWLLPILLIWSGAVTTTAGYMAALAFGAGARLALSAAWFHHRSRGFPRPRVFWRGKPLLLDGRGSHGALVVANVTNQVLARHGDVFVAGLVGLAASTIGSYALAFQITAAGNQFLLLGVGAVALSRLAENHLQLDLVRARWRRLTRVAATLAFGPECVIVLAAPEIVHLTVGGKYPGAVGLLRALAATQWAGRLAGGGTNIGALIALGDMRYVAQSALLGASLNLGLDFGLSLLIGPYGLAAGTAIALVVVGLVNIRSLSRTFAGEPGPATSSPLKGWGRAMKELPLAHLGLLTLLFLSAQIVALTTYAPSVRGAMCVGVIAIWVMLCVREVRAHD